MELSIVIVNYKSQKKLANCLASLAAAPPASEHEIIVVDNASGDDLSALVAAYPRVRWLNSPANRGMGAGNNLGMAASLGRYILILNPDTVIQPGAIEALAAYLDSHPRTALVGPKLFYPDGSLQYSCSRWPKFWLPFLRRTFLGRFFPGALNDFLMKDYDHQTAGPVDWLMGSCLLMRRELVMADGSVWQPRFDERYFMYFEDVDLAREIWSRGHEVAYEPRAVVIHDHQRASTQRPWYLAIFLDRLARQHILSWLKYFIKWRNKK